LYKILIFLGFLFVAAPVSLPKSTKQVNKKQIFMNKFEKAYEVKTYEDFKKDFFILRPPTITN
jgi:hypothetical protein